ncbi:MAG TPA: hypothetical protein VE621_01500 [Bryobacteraceae bacterium]|nr:hypothetical protein [Bryobacteraceae bacterium]
MKVSRRDLLHCVAAGAGVRLSRAEAQVTPDLVRFHPELEPLVVLIERTPRERCAEVIVEQFRSGVSYRQAMAALFLAGIRNINPQPPGFALHCVFVIHSSHLISLEAPADLRLLPFFYALDNFKTAQERDRGQATGDYTMRATHGALSAGETASAELSAAMENWDVERAERAIVSLARSRSGSEAFDLLWRYGARDYRNIGHKAIYVANAHRTLQAIGWQHAEPVLRSLTRSLVAFGKSEQVNGYKFEDQCYRGNLELIAKTLPKMTTAWTAQAGDPAAVRSFCATLREAAPADACAEIAGRLASNRSSTAEIWDAVHLSAAELCMRARGAAAIVGIHAVTSTNALHHAYQAASGPASRLLSLLQAAGWVAQFRTWAESREEALRAFRITDLEPHSEAADTATILSRPLSDVDKAASELAGAARDISARQGFLAGALRVTIPRANEVHYYKYLAALIEDVPLVSPEWQPHLTAASLYYVKRPMDPESEAMGRARVALRRLVA